MKNPLFIAWSILCFIIVLFLLFILFLKENKEELAIDCRMNTCREDSVFVLYEYQNQWEQYQKNVNRIKQ